MNQEDPSLNARAQPQVSPPSHHVGTDSPRFAGEGKWANIESGTKAKILFVVVALGVLAIAAMALKSRWTTTPTPNANTPFTAREDAVSDRKTRNFESENPAAVTKPPIVLPPTTAMAGGAFDPNAFVLPKVPVDPTPAPARPMMVAEAAQRSYDMNAALAVSVRAAAAAASAANGAAANPVAATGTEPAEPLGVPKTQPANTNAAPGKGAQPETIEAQALRARERLGPEVTGTAQVSATKLGRRSYVLAKGAFIPCVLETQLVSNVFGMTSCVVTQNVYSDDGKMLLVERGSKVSGNYGSNLRNGDSRLAVIWDRIKTPNGITVDVNSPGSDGLGAMGLPGVVEMHWFKRIGAAVMLSVVQDTMQYAMASLAYDNYLRQQREMGTTQAQPPVLSGSNTGKQASTIPEQVLASSINATPTLYKNRGEVVYIYVANDIWFDRVYGLQP